VDREEVARAGRRAQAEEALAFEREREAALRHQIAALVLEEEGARVDAAAFAELEPEEVQLVRSALGELADEVEDDEDDEDDLFGDEPYVTFDDGEEDEPPVDEVARLGSEIVESQRVQAALERYIAVLERPAVPEAL
jgi:hypothetical protein